MGWWVRYSAKKHRFHMLVRNLPLRSVKIISLTYINEITTLSTNSIHVPSSFFFTTSKFQTRGNGIKGFDGMILCNLQPNHSWFCQHLLVDVCFSLHVPTSERFFASMIEYTFEECWSLAIFTLFQQVFMWGLFRNVFGFLVFPMHLCKLWSHGSNFSLPYLWEIIM